MSKHVIELNDIEFHLLNALIDQEVCIKRLEALLTDDTHVGPIMCQLVTLESLLRVING